MSTLERPMAIIVVALLTVFLSPSAPARAQGAPEPIETAVTFTGADRTIEGTVIAPADAASGLPGMVLVAGAGPGPDRDRYREHAEAFAEAGIVTLIYDKRGGEEGYSQFAASLEDLAADALAGLEALEDRPEVDPELVGLHGHSEGAWVVIEAAAASPAVDFVITSAGSAFTPDRTQQWMNAVQLHRLGVADGLLEPLGSRMVAAVADAGLFRLAGHDPLPSLETIDRPFLGLFAEHDLHTPAGQSLEAYREALVRGGNGNHTLEVVPGVDHDMVPGEGGSVLGDYDENAIDAGYVEAVASWVGGLASGAAGVSVDEPPAQDLRSAPPSRVPWYGTWTALLAALAAFTGLFGAYPVAALVQRLRGREALTATGTARLLAVIGLTLPAAVFLYLAMIVMSAGTSVFGPVIAGVPLPWLLFQAAAVAAAVAAVTVGVQMRRRRTEMTTGSRLRLGALLAGVVLLLPWGAYWGLLL